MEYECKSINRDNVAEIVLNRKLLHTESSDRISISVEEL